MASAASRPSRTPQTTSDAPRTMSPPANTPGIAVIMVRQSIRTVPQRVTGSSGWPNSVGRSSGSKPSALITRSASTAKLESGTGSGRCRPVASGAPRRMRTARTPSTSPSPKKASGAACQTNSTPSSSAWRTSRIEPGMLARSRR